MERRIREQLVQAYRCLGEHDSEKIEKNVKEAFSYLEEDRKHYMEVAYKNQEPDLLWYETYQVEGKFIPIAASKRVVYRSQYIAHIDNVLGLLVSEQNLIFVICRNEFRESRISPEDNAWKFTEYYEVDLYSTKGYFEMQPAKELIPLPGIEGHKAYNALLTVCEYFGTGRALSELLEKAERAMQILANIERPPLEIEGELYDGKWIPVAMEDYSKRLLMLVTEPKVQFVVESREVQGGHRKVYHKRVKLEDVSRDWRLYFY